MARTLLSLPVPHPATQGHFPGAPILPGVVLLDETVRRVEQALGAPPTRWRIASVKFLSPAAPGEPLSLDHERLASGAIRFVVASGDRTVATGLMSPS